MHNLTLIIATATSVGGYGLGAMFLALFLESTGVPFPGEVALISESVYASTHKNVNLFVIVAIAIVAVIGGSILGYVIGRLAATKLLFKYGKYVLLSKERLLLAKYLFEKHGYIVILVGRFIAVLRTYMGIFAGISEMSFYKFLVATFFSALFWATVFCLGSYYSTHLFETLSSVATYVLVPIALIAIAFLIYMLKKYEAKYIAKAKLEFPDYLENNS